MSEVSGQRRAVRLLALGLMIGLGAYWLGSRYGQHIPPAVDAVHTAATTVTPVSAVVESGGLDSIET